MTNNRWTFYGDSEELYHYGVLGMRWGVRKARYYQRKGNKYRKLASTPSEYSKDYATRAAEYERKYESAKKHLVSNSTEKLRSYSDKYRSKQSRADQRYATAQRKDQSWITSQEAKDIAYAKATKSQYKALKDAYKGERWYKQMTKAYADLKIEMDEDSMARGKELTDRLAMQSISIYADTKAKKKRKD